MRTLNGAKLHSEHGTSASRSTEFADRSACQWLSQNNCQTLFIKPGSPRENGYIEGFSDKLGDECLNREIFRNGKEAIVIVEVWRGE